MNNVTAASETIFLNKILLCFVSFNEFYDESVFHTSKAFLHLRETKQRYQHIYRYSSNRENDNYEENTDNVS